MLRHLYLLSVFLFLIKTPVSAQELDGLNLEDAEDLKMLLDDAPEEKKIEKKKKEISKKVDNLEDEFKMDELDDLELLEKDLKIVEDPNKEQQDSSQEDYDISELALPETTDPLIEEQQEQQKDQPKKSSVKIIDGSFYGEQQDVMAFDVGKEEKKLLEIAKNFNAKMAEDDWKKISSASEMEVYEVMQGDWLWKISERLFGSGFYYSKIWSLNPYITNPHEIEPGMTLVFSTGDEGAIPELQLGSFEKEEKEDPAQQAKLMVDRKGPKDDDVHDWLVEKEKLINQGVYIQYATENTMMDLKEAAQDTRSKEHLFYVPPSSGITKVEDIEGDDYDPSGFDANARVEFRYKEGFFLNTFLSTNLVQDLGKVENLVQDKIFISAGDHIYVSFDENIKVMPGDRYSIYSLDGKVDYVYSDRVGHKYTITGQLQTIRKIDEKWECLVTDSVEVFERGARVTVFTPQIDAILQTFNDRNIEAMIVAGYTALQKYVSIGNVVYLDRGRADGVEIGNVFEVYGFEDRKLKKNITSSPTYKNAELAVISLTDNFATALVIQARRDFAIGDIAISKSKKSASRDLLREQRLRGKGQGTDLDAKALDELDVELNIDGLHDDLLEQADKVEFTEDELAELERQERKRSVIEESERDLKALERLEKEIEEAEKMIQESRLDEDKLLEQQSLEQLEKERGDEDTINLEEIEENFGRLYLDQELNDKENPYGLTEFDIEEIDELLNAPRE